MAHVAFIDHDPCAMSRRARAYITAGGARHFLVGLTMVIAPWLYSAASFIPIFNLIPAVWWAWLMIAVGLACLLGSFTRNVDIARAGMIGSATLNLVLAAGVSLGTINVWWGFYKTLHLDLFIALLLDHPPMYPLELLRIVAAPPSPFLALVLLAVTVKDYAMCAQPLRVPLEDRVRVVKPKAV